MLSYEIAKDILTFGIAIAALVIAGRGVSAWRRQVKDTMSVDRAVSLLDSALDYAQSVGKLSGFVFQYRKWDFHTWPTDGPPEGTPEHRRNFWTELQDDYKKLLGECHDNHAQFLADAARVQVWWGDDTLKSEVHTFAEEVNVLLSHCARGMFESDLEYEFWNDFDTTLDAWWPRMEELIAEMRGGLGRELDWYVPASQRDTKKS